jgi:hypothetical protein
LRRHRIRLATAEESDARETMGRDLRDNAVDLTVVRRDADGTLRSFSITAADRPIQLEDDEFSAQSMLYLLLKGGQQ